MKLNDKAVNGLKSKNTKYYMHGDMSNGRHGFAICVYPASDSRRYVKPWLDWMQAEVFRWKDC